jgi:hypothetical protein
VPENQMKTIKMNDQFYLSWATTAKRRSDAAQAIQKMLALEPKIMQESR